MTALNPRTCLVLTNIPIDEWCYRVDEQRRLIGRAPEAAIRVPACFPTVSRRHAEVWRDHFRTWIRDRNSLTGTRVNGVPINGMPQASIEVGDRLWLGGVQMEVVAEKSLPDSTSDVTPKDQTQRATQAFNLTDDNTADFGQLTYAEREVVIWLSRGYYSDEAIAEKVFRSPHTIRTQIGSIFQKLRLHSRGEVVNWLNRVKLKCEDRPAHKPLNEMQGVEDTVRCRYGSPSMRMGN